MMKIVALVMLSAGVLAYPSSPYGFGGYNTVASPIGFASNPRAYSGIGGYTQPMALAPRTVPQPVNYGLPRSYAAPTRATPALYTPYTPLPQTSPAAPLRQAAPAPYMATPFQAAPAPYTATPFQAAPAPYMATPFQAAPAPYMATPLQAAPATYMATRFQAAPATYAAPAPFNQPAPFNGFDGYGFAPAPFNEPAPFNGFDGYGFGPTPVDDYGYTYTTDKTPYSGLLLKEFAGGYTSQNLPGESSVFETVTTETERTTITPYGRKYITLTTTVTQDQPADIPAAFRKQE